MKEEKDVVSYSNLWYAVVSGVIGVYCILKYNILESWTDYDHYMIDKVEYLVMPVINYPAHSFFPMVSVLFLLLWIIDNKVVDEKK